MWNLSDILYIAGDGSSKKNDESFSELRDIGVGMGFPEELTNRAITEMKRQGKSQCRLYFISF